MIKRVITFASIVLLVGALAEPGIPTGTGLSQRVVALEGLVASQAALIDQLQADLAAHAASPFTTRATPTQRP